MIISMRLHATKEEIEHVCERIREFGYKVHSIQGEQRVVIGAVGVGDVTACLESLEAAPGVESAVRISAPYKFVSREFKKERTTIPVNGVEVGGSEFAIMAGPCSVESEKQIMETAEAVAATGAKILRGGAFKPRTSPYDFQGLEREGLKLLAKARQATGLAIVTEVMSEQDVEVVAEHADIVQVGARNMQNFMLLKALGECPRPVLLKRGMSSTIKELLMSAEYITAHGNPNIMLCERGIRTFETATRNTMRYRRRATAQRANPFARHPRSQPRHRQAQLGAGAGARGRGRGRGRAAHRSASFPRKSLQRRRAISYPRPVPGLDQRPQALSGVVEGIARLRRRCGVKGLGIPAKHLGKNKRQ